jgi:hypothetical protein
VALPNHWHFLESSVGISQRSSSESLGCCCWYAWIFSCATGRSRQMILVLADCIESVTSLSIPTIIIFMRKPIMDGCELVHKKLKMYFAHFM